MQSSATNLSEMINRRVEAAVPIRLAQVSSVNEDLNTVNLQFGSTIVNEVPCSSGYPIRAIGDSVLVLQVQAGNWIVLAKAVDAEPPVWATVDALETAVEDLNEDLKDGLEAVEGDTKVIGWGTGNAGPEWTEASSVWFRDVGDGKREIYFQTPAPPTSSTKPPPVPPKTAPKSVVLQPTDEGAWRDGGQTDTTPWQGDWTGRGDWRGGWFYGGAIADACAGRSVKWMMLRISRSTKANTGWNSGVPVRLGLHDRETKGKPTMAEGPRTPFKLEPGQVRDYTLPAAWRDLLASGDMKGFVVDGNGRGDYLKFGGASGRLAIAFNP